MAYNDNVLVGAREWNGSVMDVPAMGYDESIETAGYSEEGDHIRFKVLQESTGKIYQVMGSVPSWESNELFTVGVLQSREMPEEMLLVSAYPNPFNPVTSITFGIESDAEVSVKVFDISGREIVELANNYYLAGYHNVDWDAADQSSGNLPDNNCWQALQSHGQKCQTPSQIPPHHFQCRR
jgi:hypothetical protein